MDMISFKKEVLRLIAFRQEGEYQGTFTTLGCIIKKLLLTRESVLVTMRE